MKVSVLLGAMASAAIAAAVATPSSAQPYGYYGRDPCQAQQHDSGATGAIVGGLAGALLGSSVAPHHGNRAGGAAIGGVAGALLGNSLGRSSAKTSDTCRERDYENSYYGYPAYGRGGYYPSYGAYSWNRPYVEPARPVYPDYYGYAEDDDDDD